MSVKYDFHGRLIAVTGGASGIGLATVKMLARAGAIVSIADVQPQETLDRVVADLAREGHEAWARVVDVADREQVDAWIGETVRRCGRRLDGAANVAGVIGTGINKNRVEEIEEADWAFVLGVNLTGVMHCMRSEIQNMNEGGSIVNVTSVAGSMGIAKNAAYSAAKHGVVGLSRSAAKEVGDRRMRVNCVAPGRIETPLQLKSVETLGPNIPTPYAIKRKGEADEVASAIVWLLSDVTKFVSGTIQLVDGAWIC